MMSNRQSALLLLLLFIAGSLFWALHRQTDLIDQPRPEPITELTLSEFSALFQQKHNIQLHWWVKQSVTAPISSELLTLPPEPALLQALPGYKLFVVYPPQAMRQPDFKPSEIWIAPPGFQFPAASASKPNCFPQNKFADTENTRLSIDQIAAGGNEAAEAFASALRNPDEIARYRAVIAASESHMQNIGPILTELLQTDASEIVRSAALDALSKAADVDKPTFIGLINMALQDESTNVRNRAMEFSTRLQSEP